MIEGREERRAHLEPVALLAEQVLLRDDDILCGTTHGSSQQQAAMSSRGHGMAQYRDAPKLMMRVSEQRWPMLISFDSTLHATPVSYTHLTLPTIYSV